MVFTASLLGAQHKKGIVWRTSRQACLLCPWARHLTGRLHFYVANRWPIHTSPGYDREVANLACRKRRLLGTTSGNPPCWWWGYQSLITGSKWVAIFFFFFFLFFYLPYLSSIHEKANCIAILWTGSPHSLGSCLFRGLFMGHLSAT